MEHVVIILVGVLCLLLGFTVGAYTMQRAVRLKIRTLLDERDTMTILYLHCLLRDGFTVLLNEAPHLARASLVDFLRIRYEVRNATHEERLNRYRTLSEEHTYFEDFDIFDNKFFVGTENHFYKPRRIVERLKKIQEMILLLQVGNTRSDASDMLDAELDSALDIFDERLRDVNRQHSVDKAKRIIELAETAQTNVYAFLLRKNYGEDIGPFVSLSEIAVPNVAISQYESFAHCPEIEYRFDVTDDEFSFVYGVFEEYHTIQIWDAEKGRFTFGTTWSDQKKS